MNKEHKIFILPDEKEINCKEGDNLLQVLADAGLGIRSVCGGEGTCQRCRVIIDRDGEKKSVLACQTDVRDDLKVRIPESSRLTGEKILVEETDEKGILRQPGKYEEVEANPLFHRELIELPPPSLIDNSSDYDRLKRALKQKTGRENYSLSWSLLQKLGARLRSNNWKVGVSWINCDVYNEIIDITAPDEMDYYGLAVDIGTTTVVVQLVDLATGLVIDVKGEYNGQGKYGEDVISRINHASKNENGLSDLYEALIKTLNDLIEEIVTEQEINPDNIYYVLCAGNTTMIHSLYKVNPNYIRKDPYIPTFYEPPALKAADIGLNISPEARIYAYPAIGSFVGGDIVAGVLSTGMYDNEQLTLFIDIGTNGEIVLGNKDFLMACSASAGPAFEGGGIKYGMRAMDGAIERIEISDKDYEVLYKTINNRPPVGLCGTGLIDILATLQAAEIINRSGEFNTGLPTDRIREGSEGYEMVLVYAEETGIGEDIVITTTDIKHLMRSKAAIYAGIRMLLNNLSLEEKMIKRVLIGGGFGNYLNIDSSINIGLLPDLPRDNFKFLGNSSLRGARKGLVSCDLMKTSKEIAAKMTYLELSAENQATDFMNEFVAAKFLPHTDLDLFPSVKKV